MSVVTRIRTSEELTVPFTRDEVWAVLADVDAYPDWWPAKLRVEVLHHANQLLGAEFEVRPLMGRMFRIRFEEIEDPRSMRLRFFGGSLEGPGGFHLHALDGATEVKYEMDVFARGLDVAVLSTVVPLERIHRSRMRSVLNSLSARLKELRRAADREGAQAARLLDRENARRQAEAEAAARRALEETAKERVEQESLARAAAAEARKRAEEEAAARVAAEQEARRAAEEEVSRLAAEEAAKRRAEEEALARAAAAEARKRAEEEAAARAAAEQEARRAAEEEVVRLAAEEAAKKRAEEEALARAAAAEARRRAEEEAAAREAAEQEARRAAEEEVARLAAEEAAKKRAEEEALARAAAAEARRRAEEEAAAREAAEQEARRAAEEEVARLAAEEAAMKRAEEEAFARAAAAEARKRAEEEAAARAAAEQEARRAAEEEVARLAAEEAAKKRAEEEALARAAEEARSRVEEEAAVRRAAEALARTNAEEQKRETARAADRAMGESARPPALTASASVGAEPMGRPAVAAPELNFEIARRYLGALSSSASPEEIGSFLAAEVIEEEFPHRFLASAVSRGRDGIIEARSRALNLFPSQRYQLAGETGGGSLVALELRWRGTIATTGEGFTEGEECDARMAMFLKFAEGRIVRQRVYRCFEPWSTKAERALTLDERVTHAGQRARAHAPGPASPGAPGTNFEISRRYLDALGSRADADAVARFFASDAVRDDFPNRFLPEGGQRDLPAIRLARTRGLALLTSERYELLGATGGGSEVALEVEWNGVVGEDPGPFNAGQRLESRIGIFLTFRDGLIVSERNYACPSPNATEPAGRRGLRGAGPSAAA